MQGAHSCIGPLVLIIYTAAQFVNSMVEPSEARTLLVDDTGSQSRKKLDADLGEPALQPFELTRRR
jgi:hypothetical protein